MENDTQFNAQTSRKASLIVHDRIMGAPFATLRSGSLALVQLDRDKAAVLAGLLLLQQKRLAMLEHLCHC